MTHANQPSHLYWGHRVESVDETFQGFAQGCAMAGPSGCPLATNTSTGSGIIDWTTQLLGVCAFLCHRSEPRSHPKQLAHDYAKSSGNDNFKSVILVGAIHQALYQPSGWAAFAAGDFLQFYQAFIQASGSTLSLASRSLPELKRQSSQNFQDYTFQAITCGDSIDQDNVTTQAVFDELVRVVREVSPMCK